MKSKAHTLPCQTLLLNSMHILVCAQVSVETALLCDVLDASTLNSERDPGQESMCNELARNLGIYNTRMVKLMEEVGFLKLLPQSSLLGRKKPSSSHAGFSAHSSSLAPQIFTLSTHCSTDSISYGQTI